MKSVYIYPTYTPNRDKSGNLYIKYFHEAFKSSGWKVCNRLWYIGIFSLFANLNTRLFIIQWIDLLPKKRFGKIQFVFFVIGILFLKLINRRVLWVLHNKKAHNGDSLWVDWGMSFMAKFSDYVLTHSEEGVSFFNQNYPKHQGKCFYIPHPVYSSKIYKSQIEKWDYVIWGSISPRKNVAEFLEFAHNNDFFRKQKILICGRCSNREYARRIEMSCGDNITFENRFLTDSELSERIRCSKCVVFTYLPDSVLSSGALIYSINFCKPIIGPKVGSFEDLKDIVKCYDTFEDIPNIKLFNNESACVQYIKENTWSALPEKVESMLKEMER